MKPNRFKQVLAEGKVPVGHMVLEFGTRGMPQILEATGIDFVVIDLEHSGFTMADIADMMTGFKATSLAPFVRIPQIEYHFIARTLDTGALGIMVPDVKNGSEAKAIVEERLEELEKTMHSAQQQFGQIAERINAGRSRVESLLATVRKGTA